MNASASPRGCVLCGIGEVQARIGAVAEQPLEQRLVLRRGDDKNVPDPGEHQSRQRIIDHRLVEDRQQLLRNDGRHRVKTCAAPPARIMPFIAL